MNLYYELLQYPVFSSNVLVKYYRNQETARTALKRLLKEGLVVKIRRNMYTCISGESQEPVANRFQIGSAVTDTAYLSHHSAVELYGAADQVYYDVYVSSETKFNEFEFGGYSFRYLPSKCSMGITSAQLSGGIRVTDRERTVIDCIKDMDQIGGVEETLENIAAFSVLSEDKLLQYLACYGNQFLYQKTAFILQQHQERLKLSDQFFEICHSKIGMSKRYFTKDDPTGHYDRTWRLVVPEGVFRIKNGEGDDRI